MIDSAGIGNWHVGQLPDKRMREHGRLRGYSVDHRARQFDERRDFELFDKIVVMDEDNYRNITSQAPNETAREKVVRWQISLLNILLLLVFLTHIMVMQKILT